MKIKEQIIEELKTGTKTASEIADNLDKPVKTIRTTITRMLEKDLILMVGIDENRKFKPKVYSINPDKVPMNNGEMVKWLDFMNKMFVDNVDYLMKNEDIVKLVMENSEILNAINKVIESARTRTKN